MMDTSNFILKGDFDQNFISEYKKASYKRMPPSLPLTALHRTAARVFDITAAIVFFYNVLVVSRFSDRIVVFDSFDVFIDVCDMRWVNFSDRLFIRSCVDNLTCGENNRFVSSLVSSAKSKEEII